MKVSRKMITAAVSAATIFLLSCISAYAQDGVVTASVLNVRGGGWDQADKIGEIAEGTGVHIQSVADGGWLEIFYNGISGYVKSDYVRIIEGCEAMPKTYAGVLYGRVNVSVLNVRAGASFDSRVCRQLSGGSKVEIRGTQGDFYIIENGDWNAFVAKEYIDIISYEEYSAQPQGCSGVVDVAMQYIGTPYRYGGSSPSGFDCSGFTSYVYAQMGVSLNRTAAGQASNGVAVDRDELAPGDLVMFNTGGGISHVGLYIGGGNMIHSPYSGRSVCVESIDSGYYAGRFVCARRIL